MRQWNHQHVLYDIPAAFWYFDVERLFIDRLVDKFINHRLWDALRLSIHRFLQEDLLPVQFVLHLVKIIISGSIRSLLGLRLCFFTQILALHRSELGSWHGTELVISFL